MLPLTGNRSVAPDGLASEVGLAAVHDLALGKIKWLVVTRGLLAIVLSVEVAWLLW